MTTAYPGALDALTNPSSAQTLAAVPHHTQHGDANDAIKAIETKLGIGASTPAVSGYVLTATSATASAWSKHGLPAVTILASGGDDLAAFQAAILASVATNGVRIQLPDDVYLLSAQLHINQHNVHLLGGGPSSGQSHFIRRTGAITTGDAVIRWGGKDGQAAWATWPVKGGSIQGLSIDAASKCDYSLNIRSLHDADAEDLFLMGQNVSALEMNTVIDQAGTNAYVDTSYVTLDRVQCYNPNVAIGMRVGHALPATTLNGAISAAVTTVVVASAAGFPATGAFTIDVEWERMRVTAGAGTTSWTVTRGYGGTAAATHSNGIAVILTEAGTYSCSLRRFGSGSNATGPGVQLWYCDDLYFYDYNVGATGASGSGNGIGFEYRTGALNVHMMGGYAVIGTQPYVVRATGLDLPAAELVIIPLSVIDQVKRPRIETGGLLYYVATDGYHTFRPDPKTYSDLTDDLYGTSVVSGSIGKLGWLLNNGAITTVDYEGDHPGIKSFNTITIGTINSLYVQNASSNGMVDPGRNFDETFIFKLVTSGVLTDVTARVGIGMQNDTGDPPANGIYIEKLYADTTWFAVCRAAGVQTRVALPAAVFDTWVHLRFRRFNDTSIGFRFNHAWPLANLNQSALISTNVPTPALSPFFQLKNQAGAGKYMYVDLFQHSLIGLDR